MNKYFIAGFIAGEGSFSFTIGKNRSTNCCFVIEVHKRDAGMLVHIQKLFDYGHIVSYPRKPNMRRYTVTGVRNCRKLVIPFMDKYLIGSYKRDQYRVWRKKVKNHWIGHPVIPN